MTTKTKHSRKTMMASQGFEGFSALNQQAVAEATTPQSASIALKEYLMTQWLAIAGFDISDAFDSMGTIKPLDEWPDRARMAVDSVELSPDGSIKKVKFYNKQWAMSALTKYVGLLDNLPVDSGDYTHDDE